MCQFRTVKVATFTPKPPLLVGVQGAIVQDNMFVLFLATSTEKTYLTVHRQTSQFSFGAPCLHSSSVSKLGQTQRQNNKKTRQQNHNKEIENTTTQPTTVFHPTMNKPTEVLMPAPSIVALIGNIKATLIYIKPNKKFLFFACGTSVTGSVFGRTGELENNVLSE